MNKILIPGTVMFFACKTTTSHPGYDLIYLGGYTFLERNRWNKSIGGWYEVYANKESFNTTYNPYSDQVNNYYVITVIDTPIENE